MAARATWKGYLKISLVTIPIRVFPATDAAATISFNQLHRECRTRIQQKRWCPTCQVEVPNTDIVKGFEFEKGRYAVLEDEDIAKVRPESTRVINVVQFADASVIDPVYVERPYYLAPDGNVAAEAFAVMREGMAGKAAVGKLALYGREYLVAIQPRENGLVMYTLRHAEEVRSMSAIDELQLVPARIKPDEVKLAKQVISNFETEGDLDELQGRVPGRAAEGHRRQDRGAGGGGAGGGGAAEGGEPHGGAPPESRAGLDGQEEGREDRGWESQTGGPTRGNGPEPGGRSHPEEARQRVTTAPSAY